MKATFIDCYVKDDSIILWLKDGKKNIKLIDKFVPEIFLKSQNLRILQRRLRKKGIESFFKKRKTFFNGTEINVLGVPIYKLSRYHEITRDIEMIENYSVEIYNADLKLEEAYMFEKDLFPTAKVEYEECDGKIKEIKVCDEPDNVDYEIPDFSVGKIKIKTKESLFKTLESELSEISYNDETFSGELSAMLNRFKEVFERNDPDLIWTEHGNLVLPYLKQQFNKQKIKFNFNRFEPDDFKYSEGESYWAYTNIIYRTASVFLKGRLHFDTRSFFADDTGFWGIIDGARVCHQRIQRVEMRSAGAAVTNLLVYESYKKGFLLPYKVGIYERFKTMGQLYEADRGSIIFEPQIGFHTDVVEFDFVSLYPQIMWKYNLSPETLFCKCCPFNKVPGLHYNFCGNKRGIVSLVAERLIKRRISLKKKGGDESKEKAGYLKWLLVTMFGYQAFKNRKIGSIEIHESIQAFAREIILKTVRIAESRGWEVVHGIVDSVYIKKKGHTGKDIEGLKEEIIEKTGFQIAHEGNYRWMVFLPSIANEDQPVSNHFYGILENGEIKCRGIEARRSDMPEIINKMQTEMINVMAKAKNEEQFRSTFREVFRILNSYVKRLADASAQELSITRRISKIDYVNNIPQKIIIEQMSDLGWQMHPGQKIDYIIQDSDHKNPIKRYIPTDSYDGMFDARKYIEMMIKATFNILQPFGVSEYDVAEKIQKTRQMKLNL